MFILLGTSTKLCSAQSNKINVFIAHRRLGIQLCCFYCLVCLHLIGVVGVFVIKEDNWSFWNSNMFRSSYILMQEFMWFVHKGHIVKYLKLKQSYTKHIKSVNSVTSRSLCFFFVGCFVFMFKGKSTSLCFLSLEVAALPTSQLQWINESLRAYKILYYYYIIS